MKKIISFILLSLFVFACSSGNNTVQKKNKTEEEPYIFDAVGTVETENPKEEKTQNTPDSTQVEEKVNETEEKNETTETIEDPIYFVQLGAFTTQEAAEEFVKESKEILKDQEFTITFSDKVNLFVVQLPPFKDRKEAEKVRNRLWKFDKFKDAFIVTEQ